MKDRKRTDNTAQIWVRTDPGLKREAETILYDLGLTPSAAITVFYKQVIRVGGLPFSLMAAPPEAPKPAVSPEPREPLDPGAQAIVDQLVRNDRWRMGQ